MTKQGLRLTVKGICISLAVCAAGFIVWAAFWGDITVKRNEAQVVEIVGRQLEKMASEEGQKKNAVAKNLRIKRVEISLTNNIAITAEIEGRYIAQTFSATVHAVGVPEYHRNERAFFFKASEFTVPAFAYKGASVADKTTALVRRITKNDELNSLASEFAPKIEEWITHFAEMSVKSGLERFPVYRLKDDTKGWLISVALKSVEVKNGEIIAVVSIWQITWTVLLWFLIAVVLFVGFFAAPDLMMGLAFFGAIS